MQKVYISQLFVCALLAGCATSFKTEMQNSPMAMLTGPNVYIDIINEEGKTLVTPFSDVIRAETYKYMAARGFSVAKSKSEAHTVLQFSPGLRNHEVDVPGQTYVVPVYQPGQQANYNFYNNSGGSVYGTVQSQGTTQWQTGYREGYKTQIQDQWLQIAGFVQENGVPPKQAFGGQIWRTSNNVEFFSNENTLRQGVAELLDKTMLAHVSRAPASATQKRPGCRPMVGFEIDPTKVEKGQSIIKRVMPNSAAEEAGLKNGDEIKLIAGYSFSEFS
ncbi:MAG: PDZ domain-containing protein, partial [Bdellovibrionales bacterium]